jgi:predicted transcriptional regulator
VRALAEGRADGQIGDVMTRELVSCRPEDDLDVAERLMAQHQKSRIICCDQDGTLRGVISLSDIAEREPADRAGETLREVSSREATVAELPPHRH